MDKIRVLIINDDSCLSKQLSQIVDSYPILQLEFISSTDSFIDLQISDYDLILLDFVISKSVGNRIISGTCKPMYDFIKKLEVDCVIMSDEDKEMIPSYYKGTDVWEKTQFHRIPYLIMERILKRSSHVHR